MRPRPAFILLAATIVLAVIATPFVPTTPIIEPADDGVERGDYIAVLVFFGVVALFGWAVGYFNRGAEIIGLIRYIIGNLIMAGALTFILLTIWAGVELGDGLFCLFGVAPPIWLGVVLTRWHVVRGGDNDTLTTLPDKRDQYGFQQGMTLHGSGSEVSLPVKLVAGTYRLGYHFSAAGTVDGCSVVLSNADNPRTDKQTVAVPESTDGAIVFAVPEDARYVFEVDAVNSLGESLLWELTIDRI